MFADLWDEFVHIDSNLLKTLTALLFRPGKLTVDYLAGKRVRYIAPVKLYLSVSFFFFTFVAWKSQRDLAPSVLQGQAKFNKALNDAKAGHHPLALISPASSRGIDTGAVHIQFGPTKRDDKAVAIDSNYIPASLGAYRTAQDKLPRAKRDSLVEQFVKYVLIRYETGDAAGLLGGLFDAGSKMMFLVLPIFALLLKLLYVRSGRLYAEHFVYALHIHSVAFLLLMIDLLLPPWAPGWILMLGFVAYGFLAQRTVYRQGVIKTAVKAVVLVNLYSVVITVAVVVTLLLSLAMQTGFLASVRAML